MQQPGTSQEAPLRFHPQFSAGGAGLTFGQGAKVPYAAGGGQIFFLNVTANISKIHIAFLKNIYQDRLCAGP